MFNRDLDYYEEPYEQEVRIDREEYDKMKEQIENFEKFLQTIKELIEERDRTYQEKLEDIEEEIRYYEDI